MVGRGPQLQRFGTQPQDIAAPRRSVLQLRILGWLEPQQLLDPFRLAQGSLYHLSPFVSPLAPRVAERLFAWETRRGRTWGPILFSVCEPTPS